MFCKDDYAEGERLSCSAKWFSEIVSFVSLIFSFFVVIITATKTKMNLVNKLILQILIAEILDGFTILMVIIDDAQGHKIFHNYINKTYVCFTQIYLACFICFWTLSASFFISLRMYDIIIKKNTIFKTKILEKYSCLISIIIPIFLTWILWIFQVLSQSSKHLAAVNTMVKFYNPEHSHDYFRHLYCWFKEEINIVIFCIAMLIIGVNIYFSIIKGFMYMRKVSGELRERTESTGTISERRIKKKLSNMDQIKKTLWLYPFISAIVWISFFVSQILVIINRGGYPGLSFFTCFILSARQIIFVAVFLITQNDIYKQLVNCCCCCCKCKRKKIPIKLNLSEGEKLIDE